MPQTEEDLTLAGLAHDLNNVFQMLIEAADLLGEDAKSAPMAAAILRSVERGREITLSMQSGEHQPSAEIATIVDRAKMFVEDLLISGRGPHITFALDLEPGLELQRSRAWERVLTNLFSNSVRAMAGQGGTISVQARRAADTIELTVSDDGPGIMPSMLSEIFKPHVSSRSEGGMGLHIVETIVHQENGTVRGGNGPNGGARFTITIPAASFVTSRVRRASA
jgi:signal transduction histidine kinase